MSRTRRQRLGQHFLVDHRVAERIAGLLAAEPARVVEIGPGRGALTAPLLERCNRVLALELDEQLLPELARRFADQGLELRHADALHEPLEPLLAADAPWQLAANLPYSVGSAILRRLLPRHDLFVRLVVMLQLEVVERITAEPGDKQHGLLALERAAHADAEVMLRVPPGAFRPRPKVSSAVVRLDLHPPAWPTQELQRALALAARAYTGRRKMLGTTLRGQLSAEQISTAGIDPRRRPAELSLPDWINLARAAEQ